MDILTYPIIGFGKHKGKAFNRIPAGYISWMANNISDPYLKACASAFLRDEDAPEPEDCIYITHRADTNEIEINATFALKSDITELSERHWDGDHKRWMIPLHCYDEVMRTFPKAHLSAALKTVLGDKLKKQVAIQGFIRRVEPTIDIEFDDPELHLYPFQRVAVEFIEANNGRALLACEQGTGKTMDVIGYMRRNPGMDVVIVCPAVMKNVWATEVKKWLGVEPVILSGQKGVIPDEEG